MAAPNRKDMRATPSQRAYIRALLDARELPVDVVTVLHRDIFRRAGVGWQDGQRMDELLATLNWADIDRLVSELRDDEEDDD